MTMKKLLKIIPAVSFVGTVVFSILYENTSLEILLQRWQLHWERLLIILQ